MEKREECGVYEAGGADRGKGRPTSRMPPLIGEMSKLRHRIIKV